MVAVCWYVTAVFEFDRLFHFIDEIFNSMMAHELTTQEKNIYLYIYSYAVYLNTIYHNKKKNFQALRTTHEWTKTEQSSDKTGVYST